MRDRRDKEVIGGCVSTGDASIITSDGEFSASGAGGVTTIYLPKNFRILGISGCGSCIFMVDTVTQNSFRIVTVNTVGGAAVAATVWFNVSGWRE